VKRFRSLFIFFALSAGFVTGAFALEIPKRPDGYVTDKAGMLSGPARLRLEQTLAAYEAATSNQVMVVTFPSMEEESLEDFSMRLAEAWKPGQKDKDNGVIFLLFRDDRKMRIEVGYGLEGVLPDALAIQIMNNQITPYFKAGRFEEGILAGVGAIIQATKGEYKGTARPGRSPYGSRYGRGRRRRPMTPEEARGLMIFIMALVGILFFVDFFRFRGYAGGHGTHPDRYSFWEWWFRFGLLLFILSMLFRIMFYSMLFSRGGYYGSRGGFGGGGFSGGGGGFGGGGASGGW